MFSFILIFTICFVIFIEYYFGSIVFRPDSTNTIVFNLPSLVNFLLHPLHNSFLWNPEVIMGNYPCMLLIGLLIYYILNGFNE